MRPGCARAPAGGLLVKAWDGDTLGDLIYCPKGLPVNDDVIARGEELSVLGMEMRVMALEDVMATKLMALSEHSLRSPFARAFFTLIEGLDILPPARGSTATQGG